MDSKTKEMIRGWVAMHNGDIEAVARWMRSSFPIGIRAARAMIAEAA